MEAKLTRDIKSALLEFYVQQRGMYAVQECRGMDVLAISDVSYELEVKISLSDLKADVHKQHHRRTARTNYFYYVVPTRLSQEASTVAAAINPKYGIMTYACRTRELRTVKRPVDLRPRADLWRALMANLRYGYKNMYAKVVLYEHDRQRGLDAYPPKVQTFYRNMLKTFSLDVVEQFTYNGDVEYGTRRIVFAPSCCIVGSQRISYNKGWYARVIYEVTKWINEQQSDTLLSL